MGSQVLDFELQLLLCSAGSALFIMSTGGVQHSCVPPSGGHICMYLKGEVLQEVGGAICLCCLGARTGINPHANGGGLGVGRVLGGDGQAILEGGGLGLDGRRDGSREGAPQGCGRVGPPSKALGQVESKSPRGHREDGSRRRRRRGQVGKWSNICQSQHRIRSIASLRTWSRAFKS